MTDFADWSARGFQAALLPVIPPLVRLSPNSTVPPDQRGKVPGVLGAGGWHSFAWRDAPEATADDLKRWQGMGAGLGIRCDRTVRAVDIDCTDATSARILQQAAELVCGETAVRIGRAPKLLLLYRAAGPLRKRKIAFWLPGQDRAPPAKPHAVELLADGQQFVAEGTHPVTGQPYSWPYGRPALSDLPLFGEEAADALWRALGDALDMLGAEIAQNAIGDAAAREDVDQASLAAPSPEVLAEALGACPNDGSREAWIAMGIAIKAAGGTVEMWEEWSNRWGGEPEDIVDLARRWDGFRGPFAVGWPYIEIRARGAGWTGSARLDFEAVAKAAPVVEPRKPSAADAWAEAADDGEATTLQERMFAEWRWIESVERFGSVVTGDMLTRTQFNVRMAHIGPPHSSTACAAAVFLADAQRRKDLAGPTYWPGKPREVVEPVLGRCLNRWRPSDLVPDASATEAEVEPWLAHLRMLVPERREREHLLNWMACLLQRPGVKINYAPVMGGKQGIGKDLLWQPIWRAIGMHNVRTVDVDALQAAQTDYVLNVQVLVVNEIHSGTRVALGEKLKPIIAAPPDFLRINTKMVPQYDVPNRVVVVMFTNRRDALAIENGDRRYFVLWSECEPREAAYYEALADWYAAGGREKVAGWLLKRDLKGFSATARAPETAAKVEMARDGRSDLHAAVADAIEADEWPDVVNPEDLAERLNHRAGVKGRGFTGRGVAVMLKQLGAKALNGGGLVRMLAPTKTGATRARLYAVRDFHQYGAMPPAALARAFAEGWAKIEGRELTEAEKQPSLVTVTIPVTDWGA